VFINPVSGQGKSLTRLKRSGFSNTGWTHPIALK
jgi:hypothetical protein